jgi:hypothetical protein
MLDAFCRTTALTPPQVAMIGDSVHDLHSGRAAGMFTIGVLTGPAEHGDLAPLPTWCWTMSATCPRCLHCRRPRGRRNRPLSVGKRRAGGGPDRSPGNGNRGRKPIADRRTARGAARIGRAARPAAIAQMPWRIPVNTDRPTEPLSPEGVAAIHDAAMRVLEETGIEFLHPEACAAFVAAGCRVEGHERAHGPGFRDGDGRPRAGAVRHHPAQPGAADHARRAAHGLRQRLLAAERDGPRPRPAGRGFRELPAT